jgi:hypothetical protein
MKAGSQRLRKTSLEEEYEETNQDEFQTRLPEAE